MLFQMKKAEGRPSLGRQPRINLIQGPESKWACARHQIHRQLCPLTLLLLSSATGEIKLELSLQVGQMWQLRARLAPPLVLG